MIAKKHECKIVSSWFDESDNASLTIITPKGTTLRIDRYPSEEQLNKWDKVEVAWKLVWTVCGASLVSDTIELTTEQVMLWHKYSQYQGQQV